MEKGMERSRCGVGPGASRATRASVLVGFALVAATLVLPVGAAVAAPIGPAHGGPSHPFGTSTGRSTNWAGYAVTTKNNAVTDVKGSWTQPAFKGTCGGLYNLSYASFWVGIDGAKSNTVEQIGTSVECSSVLYVSSVSYFAWYEFYPAGSVRIGSLTISAGDTMHAEVKYSPTYGSYTLSIKDAFTGKSYSTSSSSITANRSSAEWIAEAPSSALGAVYPLVDFGTAHFTGCTATISGHTHPIGGFANIRYTMVTTSGTANKAVPGALGSGGSAFAVTWKTYGP